MKRTGSLAVAAAFALGLLCFASERPAWGQHENEFLELGDKDKKKDNKKDHGKDGHKKDHKKDHKKHDKKD